MMPFAPWVLFVLAQLLLAVVFAIAAVAKLKDREGTRQANIDFGVAKRLSTPLAVALPAAEIVIAVLVLIPRTAVAGAFGALALLVVFTVTIVSALVRGHAPRCHCFGQLSAKPTSWWTVGRNAALMAVAVFAIDGGIRGAQQTAIAYFSQMEGASKVALTVCTLAALLVAVGTRAFLTLLRSYGELLIRLERVEAALADAGLGVVPMAESPAIGLPPGTPVPSMTLLSLDGKTVALNSLLAAASPVLILFTNSRCGPCKTLLPQVANWQHQYQGRLVVAIASEGVAAELRAEAKSLGLENVFLDEGGQAYTTFRASGTPSGVLIAEDGRIASYIASGVDAIGQLVKQVMMGTWSDTSTQLSIGAEVPAVELPSLDGTLVSLQAFRGYEVLVLFWNSTCGFCQAIRDQVLACEKSIDSPSAKLVVVSTSDDGGIQAEGFRSPVLLDHHAVMGKAFGAHGTPMAVLVGADGRVASEVVGGGDAVLQLANRHAFSRAAHV